MHCFQPRVLIVYRSLFWLARANIGFQLIPLVCMDLFNAGDVEEFG
jgi:hypothetical protein